LLKVLNPTQTIPYTPQPLSFFLVRLSLKDKPLLTHCIDKKISATNSNRRWNSDYRIWAERRRNCDSHYGNAVFCTLSEYYCSARISFYDAANIIVKASRLCNAVQGCW